MPPSTADSPAGSAAAPAATPAAAPSSHADRVRLADAFVKAAIAGHDSSHDWFHIERVRNTALTLAAREGLQEGDRHLAELAALLHDLADHKYSADQQADRRRLALFLADQLCLGPEEQETVLFVIDNMSFSSELARRAQQAGGGEADTGRARAAAVAADGGGAGAAQRQEQAGAGQLARQSGQEDEQQQAQLLERRQCILAVVQDADRLDAIGALGVARCLTFGGRFGRMLHDPAVPPRTALSREQYQDRAAQQTTLNHFAEKLLHLKGLMRTDAGRQLAEGRHAFMEAFLEQFHAEWRGEA